MPTPDAAPLQLQQRTALRNSNPARPDVPPAAATSSGSRPELEIDPERPDPEIDKNKKLPRWYRKMTALSTRSRIALVASSILVLGVALGITLDANPNIPQPWNRVSSILGWVYFMCWSVSFYPQVLVNYARKSVVGLSLDYITLNLLGFTCYSIFNCAFFYSDYVQREYMRHHQGNRNAVEKNDVFFALHAVVLIAVSMYQCVIYPRGGQTVGTATKMWTVGALTTVAGIGVVLLVRGEDPDSTWSVLNLLYLLSYVKLVTTLVKCVPQIVLNYQRKSTEGWTIWNILLDIAGGVLSISQEILDAWATSDWTAIMGNPVKFALGFFSILVDIVFVLQHFVWYKLDKRVHHAMYAADEKVPLLV